MERREKNETIINRVPRLTIGQLKEIIKDLPDDGIVYYQRIEDVYFEKHGWNSITKTGIEDEWDNYIPAFSTFTIKTDKNLYITAHF